MDRTHRRGRISPRNDETPPYGTWEGAAVVQRALREIAEHPTTECVAKVMSDFAAWEKAPVSREVLWSFFQAFKQVVFDPSSAARQKFVEAAFDLVAARVIPSAGWALQRLER
jgi:hypothetical protein